MTTFFLKIIVFKITNSDLFYMIVFLNDRFKKRIIFEEKIIIDKYVNEGSSLTIVIKGLSLTIVNETTHFLNKVV